VVEGPWLETTPRGTLRWGGGAGADEHECLVGDAAARRVAATQLGGDGHMGQVTDRPAQAVGVWSIGDTAAHVSSSSQASAGSGA
jgi:hypothetical protein